MPVPVKMPSTAAAADALKTGLIPLLETKSVSSINATTTSSSSSINNSSKNETISAACVLDSVEILEEKHQQITPPPKYFNKGKSCEKVSLTCDCSHKNDDEDPIRTGESQVLAEPCEDLDSDKHSLLTRSVAGGLAGLVEHLAIYPFDTLKTNTQTGLRGEIKINRNIDYVKWYGKRQAWAGVNALIPACTVAHALQFPCIEYTEKFLEKRKVSGSSFWAGIIGILPHDLVMNPANVVKQRMQQVNQERKGTIQVAKELYRSQGIGVFYRSLPAQYGVGALYMGTFYYIYNDILKNSINQVAEKFNMENEWLLIWLTRNTIATAAAVTVTQPIDLVVTRVNTGYGENGKTTIGSSIKHILQQKQFFSGWSARMSCSLPASILTWGTYEAIKYMLRDD